MEYAHRCIITLPFVFNAAVEYKQLTQERKNNDGKSLRSPSGRPRQNHAKFIQKKRVNRMRKANDDTQYSPSQTDDSETGAPKHHGAIILNPEDNRIGNRFPRGWGRGSPWRGLNNTFFLCQKMLRVSPCVCYYPNGLRPLLL